MAEESWKDDAYRAWQLLSWEGQLQWFATKEEGRKKRTLGGRINSLDALIGTIRNAEALGWNLYAQANPSNRTSKIKLSRDDITHWRYLVVDLDPTADALVPPRKADKFHRIFTGRGYQCWKPIDGPLYITDASAIERTIKGHIYKLAHTVEEWAPGWKVDTSCSDLPRVVRVPGSINQKTGKRSIVESVTNYKWPVAAALHCDKPDVIIPYLPVEVPRTFSEALPLLSTTARKFIMEGVDEGGRHSACFHTIKALHEMGMPFTQSYYLVCAGGANCRPPLHFTDIQPIARRVYGGNAVSS